MSEFVIEVRELGVREYDVSTKAAASSDLRPFFAYSDTTRLPVIVLDIRVPIYNMRNYRTQTYQLSHIQHRGLPADFFALGQEDVEAQQAQHEILWGIARQGMGDSIIAVSSALAQDARQTEPLLVTRQGVVINGNRRLSAMRELFAQDPGRYGRFASIDCLVLPAGITLDELKRIEFKLQMQPQTLLPYEWVDEALAVRDLRDSGFSNAEIATLKRLPDEDDIQPILDRLAEAEIFLGDYMHQPTDYDLVYAQEQQFLELQKALKQKRNPFDKECARRICHVMTKHSREFGSRIYDYKTAYGARSSKVLERLALRRNLAATPDLTSNGTGDDELFGTDSDSESNVLSQVSDLLSDPNESESLAVDIKQIVDELKEENREQDVGQRALRNVQRANTLLAEVAFSGADPATFGAIEAQLSSIMSRAGVLQEDVRRRIQ